MVYLNWNVDDDGGVGFAVFLSFSSLFCLHSYLFYFCCSLRRHFHQCVWTKSVNRWNFRTKRLEFIILYGINNGTTITFNTKSHSFFSILSFVAHFNRITLILAHYHVYPSASVFGGYNLNNIFHIFLFFVR